MEFPIVDLSNPHPVTKEDLEDVHEIMRRAILTMAEMHEQHLALLARVEALEADHAN
jgi:hypothetical protein